MTIKSPYLVKEPDLLFCSESCTFRPITLDYGDKDMLPAGTPISADGKVANDLTAVGLLAYDAYKGYKEKEQIILTGHVMLDKAQEHCGLVYAAEAKAALKSIIFVGDTELPAGGGSLPFGEETVYGDTLTWDGNTEGLEVAGTADTVYYYRISDATPTAVDSYTFVSGSGDTYNEEILPPMSANGLIMLIEGLIIIVTDDAVGVDIGGFSFEKTGVYSQSVDGSGAPISFEFTINGYNGFETKVVTPIDKKYLPEALRFGEEIVTKELLNTRITIPADESYFRIYKTFKLIFGKTYTVTWEGQEYECIAQVMNDMLYIGDAQLSAFPFVLAPGNEYTEVMVADTSGREITVKVVGDVVEITPIEKKFLPFPSIRDESEIIKITAGTTVKEIQNIAENAHGLLHVTIRAASQFKEMYVYAFAMIGQTDGTFKVELEGWGRSPQGFITTNLIFESTNDDAVITSVEIIEA